MSYQQLSRSEEMRLAEEMYRAIDAHTPEAVMVALRADLHALGDNVLDEVEQFRLLRRACVASAELAAALDEAGFGRIDQMTPMEPDPGFGRVVQVFNRMVEEYWEDTAKPAIRKVVYTRDDLDPV